MKLGCELMPVSVRRSHTCLTVLLAGLLALGIAHTGYSQEQEGNSTWMRSSPEAAVQFYESFLTLYMRNHRRIRQLRSMRSSGAREKAGEKASELREKTEDAMAEIREHMRSVPEDDVRPRVLKSMKKVEKFYSLYVDKIVTDWEPDREQILKRRRLNENDMIERDPALASTDLLRRVFLGELVTSVHFVPETRGWFQNRISSIRNWIGSKKKELYKLYVRLVSRVERVMTDDEVDEEEKQAELEAVREEWRTFWQGVGKGSEWREVRYSVNQISSFFRNRTDRLPGYQSVYREQVNRLRRQIGQLQKMELDDPFLDRTRRLRVMLLMSKMFAGQVDQSGGQAGQLIMERSISFATDILNKEPAEVWDTDSEEQLDRVKLQHLNRTSLTSGDLESINLETLQETFRFPLEALRNISQRLDANFGDRGKRLAEALRVLIQHVQDQQYVFSDGVSLLKAYHSALQGQDTTAVEDMVSFEQEFRGEHRSDIREFKNTVSQIQERQADLNDHVDTLMELNPEALTDRIESGSSGGDE